MNNFLIRAAILLLSGLLAAGCASSGDSASVTAAAPSINASSLVAPAAYAPSGSVASQAEKRYFISFRARNAMSYGHTFVVFGQLDANGRVPYNGNGVLVDGMTEVAGLHPASTSNVPYSLGHFIPVPAETGWSDGDTELAYLTAEWTVPLTEAEYRDVVAYIRELQDSSPVWHAVLYNCSSFVGDIAQHMGYKTPNHMLFPENYINTLKKMNTGNA